MVDDTKGPTEPLKELARKLHKSAEDYEAKWKDTQDRFYSGSGAAREEDADLVESLLPALEAEIAALKEPMAADVETLAAKFHDIYQQEAKRQGDVRHKDAYADLPENIKEFDRVLARYVLSQVRSSISATCQAMLSGDTNESEYQEFMKARYAHDAELTMREHNNHVQMMTDLYSTMIDPCAEGSMKESEMFEKLMEAARENREFTHDRDAYVQEKVVQERREVSDWIDAYAKSEGLEITLETKTTEERIRALCTLLSVKASHERDRAVLAEAQRGLHEYDAVPHQPINPFGHCQTCRRIRELKERLTAN